MHRDRVDKSLRLTLFSIVRLSAIL